MQSRAECGRSFPSPSAPQEPPKILPTSRDTASHVENALSFARQALLKLLLDEEKLLDVLRSMKHYFFLDQGDLFVHLMLNAEEELSKPSAQINHSTLSSLLELTVRASSTSSDPGLLCCLKPQRVLLGNGPKPGANIVFSPRPLQTGRAETDAPPGKLVSLNQPLNECALNCRLNLNSEILLTFF